MGRLKIESDRTNKRLLKVRVEALEKKTRLLDAVVSNLVRESGKAMYDALTKESSAPAAPTPTTTADDTREADASKTESTPEYLGGAA